MKILEKQIEKKVVRHAKSIGLHNIKLNVMGNRGNPDQLFLGPNRGILFVEFKRKGEKPKKLQKFIHHIFRRLGHGVKICDDVEDGKRLIDRFHAACVSTGSD